jgi:hypothetical protein
MKREPTMKKESCSRRLTRGIAYLAAFAGFFLAAMPASGQIVVGGDFDICDVCGSLVGNRVQLVGRSGFGTNRGSFTMINAATSDQDVDRDGYTPGVNFTGLIVSDTTDFVNVADPARVILRTNLVVSSFLNPLNNGFQNNVSFFVNVPAGTPAGRYVGQFTVRDTLNPIALNPNGEALRVDQLEVEIEVLPSRDLGLVQSDTSLAATSLTLRGRPGQTVSSVFRVANLGNADLTDVRFDVTDLVATSGTGLRIRSERITFSPLTLTNVAVGDSIRVSMSVRIPPGLLAGTYTGALQVQAGSVVSRQIPVNVIITTPGDIVFETNPVVTRSGDNAVIIFNGDPGSTYQVRIFDMMGLTVFASQPGLTVFPGQSGVTTPDLAVRFNWPLVNGNGEAVAGGMYYVVVDVQQDSLRRQLRGKLMVIR